MKFKKLKPDMYVHCSTKKEAKQFIKLAYENGFQWECDDDDSDSNILTYWNTYGKDICYQLYTTSNITGAKGILVSTTSFFENMNKAITEFADLIIPEPSAKDILTILHEMPTSYMNQYIKQNIHDAQLLENDLCRTDIFELLTPEQTIAMCEQYTSDYPLKQPEICDDNKILIINTDTNMTIAELPIPMNTSLTQTKIDDLLKETLTDYYSRHNGNYETRIARICRLK